MYYQKSDLCIHFKLLSTHHHTTSKSAAVKWYAVIAEIVESKSAEKQRGSVERRAKVGLRKR